MAAFRGRLDEDDMDQIEQWIGTGPKTFTILYSATRDGCAAATFHQKCDSQGPTITVLYNPQGSVYGGYTGQAWDGSLDEYKVDATAFLYQLKFSGLEQRTKFPVVNGNNAMYSSATYGPTFGNGHELNSFQGTINASAGVYALNGGVKLNDNKLYQVSNMSASVKSWDDINNGSMNVTDIEVYAVTGTAVFGLVTLELKQFVGKYFVEIKYCAYHCVHYKFAPSPRLNCNKVNMLIFYGVYSLKLLLNK